MKLLTGNDLASGAVIWWTGEGWSRHVADAASVPAETDIAGLIGREESARRVTGGYAVDAEETPAGPRPVHIKERIRASGPTVRPDLGLDLAIAPVPIIPSPAARG